LVELLRDAGAVFYVKTNVPTAMMIAETVNNVFGRTVNPLNRKLTSGGSSGGESALIVFGGSPLGIGTDIGAFRLLNPKPLEVTADNFAGGSLRIPAACTGIFTLRPSLGRFPTLRARSGLAGQEAVASVNGPMGKTLGDIVLFSKTVVGLEPWEHDPKCLPIPWRAVERKPKLKIGVIWNDRMVTPTPPVQRALRETVEKLKKAGHSIVDWDTSMHKQGVSLIVSHNPDIHGTLCLTSHLQARMFIADGGKSVRHILKPTEEPFRPEMVAYEDASEMGVHELWQLHLERTAFQKEYLDQWNSHGIDVLLGTCFRSFGPPGELMC
jgi:amidase